MSSIRGHSNDTWYFFGLFEAPPSPCVIWWHWLGPPPGPTPGVTWQFSIYRKHGFLKTLVVKFSSKMDEKMTRNILFDPPSPLCHLVTLYYLNGPLMNWNPWPGPTSNTRQESWLVWVTQTWFGFWVSASQESRSAWSVSTPRGVTCASFSRIMWLRPPCRNHPVSQHLGKQKIIFKASM